MRESDTGAFYRRILAVVAVVLLLCPIHTADVDATQLSN